MEITREQLYEEIWSSSVSKVAKKYAISDHLIRKKCQLYNIPLPSNQYIGRLQHGYTGLIRDPLPALESSNVISLVPVAKDSNIEKESTLFYYCTKEQQVLLTKIYSELRIKKSLSSPHVAISQHKQLLKQIKRDRIGYGSIISERGSSFCYRKALDTHSTSEQSLPRTYLFLDALIKAVEKAGGQLKLTSKHTYFVINNDDFYFRVREKYRKQSISVKNKPDWYGNTEYIPTGILTVIIGYGSYSRDEVAFNETSTTTMQHILQKVFLTLFNEFPERLKQQRLAQAIQEEKQQRERKERERQKELYADELARTQQLVDDAKLFVLSSWIELYITDLQKSDAAKSTDYLTWAKQKALWINPNAPQSDDILTEKDKLALLHQKEQSHRY
ncbi:hypothetical protein [Listeria booriae]|uniref:hypothetical protein n=1 Tax=Listeria booriae TaxID=1552123 RepID=UPI001624AA68|nr:hypothetical protein [Listeria booriae]MBC2306544.1 hypothetical protein [Listeria booriae]